jgi:hypothetical protein
MVTCNTCNSLVCTGGCFRHDDCKSCDGVCEQKYLMCCLGCYRCEVKTCSICKTSMCNKCSKQENESIEYCDLSFGDFCNVCREDVRPSRTDDCQYYFCSDCGGNDGFCSKCSSKRTFKRLKSSGKGCGRSS